LLFGDLLSISNSDLAWMALTALLGLAAITTIWRPLVSISINADLAQTDGVDIGQVRFVFIVAFALVVAIAIKVVGALLTISFLIMPAAAARLVTSTPERMVLGAMAIGVLGVLGGLWMSFTIDTPAGASIVVALTAIFAALTLVRRPVSSS
jgi:zinc transport system permease protein